MVGWYYQGDFISHLAYFLLNHAAGEVEGERQVKDISLKELLEAGAHFGHQSRRWNPAMKPYIYTQREGVHIIDLVKTKEGLEAACEYVKKVVAGGGVVLFVGTKRQAAEVVTREAARVGMPYVSQRWMGGTLTNFGQINRSVKRLLTLKDQREKGELKKYTKKEQLLLDREIARLEKFLAGVVGMEKLPDALFVVDTHREEVAVREASRVGIPVVGMVDTNGDPRLVDQVIPINDDAAKSVELVVTAIADAIASPKSQTTSPSEVSSSNDQAPKKSKTVKSKSKRAEEKTHESKN